MGSSRLSPVTLARITAAAFMAGIPALLAAPTAAAPIPILLRVLSASNPVTTEQGESGGCAWMDLNGDLYPDLYVPRGNATSQNNSLFLHTTGTNFQKVVTGPAVNDGGASIGAVFGDYDRDGHPDLFVSNRGGSGNFLYRGLGDSSFVKITTGDVITDRASSNSGSWLDLDNDGNLDLYVVNFQGDDFLYMNSGAPNYNLVRTAAPSITTGIDTSIHGAWADFDGDGDEDLFVARGGNTDDQLFINQGGLNFTSRVIPDGSSSLGGSWGDYDNDGYLDLFVPHNLNQPSILYHNDGPPNFNLTPVPVATYPGDASQSIGSSWGDFDNDGDLDLFVANDAGSNFLYLNSGPPNYTLTRVSSGDATQDGGNSFGCGWVDFDRDGALDLFVANIQNQVNYLYRNNGPTGHFLELNLAGTLSNPQAVGARVRVRAIIGGAARWMLREVTPLNGYNNQDLTVHVGLGDATEADSVLIRWPSGLADTLTHVRADRIMSLIEGQHWVAAAPAPRAGGLGLRLRSPNPARGSLEVEYTLPREEAFALELFATGGRRVGVVREGREGAGVHTARFAPAGSLASGVYWCRLSAGGETRMARALLIH